MTNIETLTAAHREADRAHMEAYKALALMAKSYETLARVLVAANHHSRPSQACESLARYAREAQQYIGPV